MKSKRYGYAPMNNPMINQATYVCLEDGTVVYDLELHELSHDRLDALESRLPEEVIASVIPSTSKEPSATTRPTVRAKVQE